MQLNKISQLIQLI